MRFKEFLEMFYSKDKGPPMFANPPSAGIGPPKARETPGKPKGNSGGGGAPAGAAGPAPMGPKMMKKQ